MSDADVRRPVAAWVWGGGLLVLAAVLPAIGSGGGMFGAPQTILAWVQKLAFAASMAVFAFGLRGRGSVVARRPSGVIALLLVGVALPLLDALTSWVFVVDPDAPGSIPDWIGTAQIVTYAGLALWGAAALVATAQIARVDAVPYPWRWAPLAALGVLAVVFLALQVIGTTTAGDGDSGAAAALVGTWGAVTELVPLALGILALALGARGVSVPARQVYPPVA